jgi:hypothetical protein
MQELLKAHFARGPMRPNIVKDPNFGKGVTIYPACFIFIPMLAIGLKTTEKMVLNQAIYRDDAEFRKNRKLIMSVLFEMPYCEWISRKYSVLKGSCKASKLHLQNELKLGNNFDLMFGIKDRESLIEYLKNGYQVCEANFAQWCIANGKIPPGRSESLSSLL